MKHIQLEKSTALFITNRINISYLTGFTGLSPTEREAYLLITENAWHLCTFQLYGHEAEMTAKHNSKIQVHFITPEQRLSSIFATIHEKEQFKTLLVEEQSITYKEYTDVHKILPDVLIDSDTSTIENLRLIKSEEEILSLKAATKISDDCFLHVQTLIHSGVSEKELAWRIERFFREQDAQISFDPIVAFNDHAASPHHVSDTSCKLQDSSLILMDFGGKVDGYHADMTRVIFFGKPQDEWINAYQTVIKAQEKAIEYIKNNKSGAQADEIARNVITEAGYPVYPHSLGHGVGLDIHENPRLSIHRDMPLEEHMVFSIEPGIYIPGKFGIRIEDLVMKTKTGIDVLSKASKEIIILK